MSHHSQDWYSDLVNTDEAASFPKAPHAEVIYENESVRIYHRPNAMMNAWLFHDANNWA